MYSRVAQDANGKPIVIDETGRRYRVVGDQIEAGGGRIGFTGTTKARPPKPVTLSEPREDGWLTGVKAV